MQELKDYKRHLKPGTQHSLQLISFSVDTSLLSYVVVDIVPSLTRH